jgi:hypothetical protein
MTHTPDRSRRSRRLAIPAIGLAGTLALLGACASLPPVPTVALSSAEQAIAAADRTRVADTASPELNEARVKLTAAQVAVQNKQMVAAERLALESRVDAELATAKIETLKAKAVNDEMMQSTATLSVEMQRKSGVQQ